MLDQMTAMDLETRAALSLVWGRTVKTDVIHFKLLINNIIYSHSKSIETITNNNFDKRINWTHKFNKS